MDAVAAAGGKSGARSSRAGASRSERQASNAELARR